MKICQKCASLVFEEKVNEGDSLLCSDCLFYMKLLNYYVAYQKRGFQAGEKERKKYLVKEGV
ncbi:MAG: hypothetical protein D5R97_03460 [Candidatus Syntrophonatronum acetioxidans]|uniref:Uncharacterized protein n=1 Tax=Candidatus Syntrophonatronum acetioxidans TaxID=1795816 RepID=A0A424YG73_9FIRM|nr:MAG: hypothetical protein D5R97_03460 [Candidatus Syntrophonatronum acetioxidans]